MQSIKLPFLETVNYVFFQNLEEECFYLSKKITEKYYLTHTQDSIFFFKLKDQVLCSTDILVVKCPKGN